MTERSIFAGIVRREPSYSQLLCNLMIRSEDFHKRILKLLTGGNLNLRRRLSISDITPEKDLAECGQADLVIDTEEVLLILEVKKSLHCDETMHQREGDYAKYLESRDRANRWLVYLVPDGWDSRAKTEERLAGIRSRGKINAHLATWEDVYRELRQFGNVSCDPVGLVHEFASLLAPQFAPITFTKQEIEVMCEASFAEAFSNIRALQFVVDHLEKRVNETFKGKCKTKRYDENDEYGFYVQRDSVDVLWVGIWTDVLTKLRTPISFGFRESWKSARDFRAIAPDQDLLHDFARVGDDWLISTIPVEVLKTEGPSGILEEGLWDPLQRTLKMIMET